MQPSVMTDMLRGLKLHGMAQALGELSAQDSPAYQAASPILSGLLKAELAEREVRSLAYQMKAARFPAYRDLAGFDFSLSQASEATVRQLHRCEFIDQAQNVVLVGGPGTDYLTTTAKQYGIFPTTLARILVERELPQIQKNRFF